VSKGETMKQMYNVKNTGKDERKFWDRYKGKMIYVKPKESVLTTSPPPEQKFWEIEEFSEEKPKAKKPKEKIDIEEKQTEDDA